MLSTVGVSVTRLNVFILSGFVMTPTEVFLVGVLYCLEKCYENSKQEARLIHILNCAFNQVVCRVI